MKDTDAQDRLFSRVCDGQADADEVRQFHQLLLSDAAALEAWLRYSELHGELAAAEVWERTGQLSPLPVGSEVAHWTTGWRFKWRPLAAAAMGMGFGLLAASMVWAYVTPQSVRPISLFEEDFEQTPDIVGKGTTLQAGAWRGNYAAITSDSEVKPASGHQMLRLLKPGYEAEYRGKPKTAGSHLGDVYRMIDVRPYRRLSAEGNATVQVAASFNAVPFPEDEGYRCAVSVYALDAETAPSGAANLGTTLTSDALAMARSRSTRLDRDPVTWQRLTTDLRLPANAEFIVIRLHVAQVHDSPGKYTFTGTYVDDVRVSLTHQNSVLDALHTH